MTPVNATQKTSMPTNADSSFTDPPVLLSVKAFARQRLSTANGSHDWEHTLRVVRLCERLGPKEGADMIVLMAAAYLHDIGRAFQDASKGAICHAEKGAVLAAPFVRNLSLTDGQKGNIIHCIESHRFRGSQRPDTLEAQVLFDADKIDAIGAIGVARAFLFAGEVGARLHNPSIDIEETESYSRDDTGYREFKVKLCKIKDRMLTPSGRSFARERHQFMVSFFDRFIQEFNGER